jgi:hypothetical protein
MDNRHNNQEKVMTKRELRKQVKALHRKWRLCVSPNQVKSFTDYEPLEECAKEYEKLYDVDREFEYHTIETLKMMLVMNQSMRVIPLHHFANYIRTI